MQVPFLSLIPALKRSMFICDMQNADPAEKHWNGTQTQI